MYIKIQQDSQISCTIPKTPKNYDTESGNSHNKSEIKPNKINNNINLKFRQKPGILLV